VAVDQRVRPVAQPPQHLESDVGGQDGEEPESFAPQHEAPSGRPFRSSLMFPLSRRGLKSRSGAAGRYGRAACARSLAQVSLRPRVRLKTSRPGVESGSGQK